MVSRVTRLQGLTSRATYLDKFEAFWLDRSDRFGSTVEVCFRHGWLIGALDTTYQVSTVPATSKD